MTPKPTQVFALFRRRRNASRCHCKTDARCGWRTVGCERRTSDSPPLSRAAGGGCILGGTYAGSRPRCGARPQSPSRLDAGGAEAPSGAFRCDWFTENVSSWEPMMEELDGRGARALEIGSFEGLSACYVLCACGTRTSPASTRSREARSTPSGSTCQTRAIHERDFAMRGNAPPASIRAAL